jgi:hypothetical protein
MFCPACGQTISDDSMFCEFCGARRASAQSAQAVAAAPAHPGYQLSREQLGGMIWKTLTLGERFIALGAAAALVGFFLPWGSVPNVNGLAGLFAAGGGVPNLGGMPNLGTSNYSGFDIARTWGGIYFVFLGAGAAGILFYLSGKSPAPKRLVLNAFQVLIGSLAGPQMLLVVLFTPMAQQFAGLGWWMTCLGYCAIAGGGMISIIELSKRVA